MSKFFAIPRVDTYFVLMTTVITVLGINPLIDVFRGTASPLDWILVILVVINWIVAAIALTRWYHHRSNQ
ncbi:hypothetical protein F3087_31965 [Nocardia colli]|uniref:Uncharacterized protein n=1 Tax=Nocardia colli TaxID=2545717 RepID=A0A5N0EAU2_9NOCA|nr:hypothetical protein [Nocardia colli]KAA8884611.1 hypothetical protein F3087_31965 [Nocardia colli]